MKANKKGKVSKIVISLLVVFTMVVNVLGFRFFNNILSKVLGGITIGSDELMTEELLYTTSYDEKSIVEAKDALGQEIAENGVTLLKRDEESGFPYEKGTKFSFFSQSCDDWLGTASGSGSGAAVDTNLKTVFEQAGYDVNEVLWKFYSEGDGKAQRGAGPIDYGDAQDYSINEVPAAKLKEAVGLEDSYTGTVAVFVFSRLGGEGTDLPRGMVADTDIAADKNKHYLEPDSVELGVLQYLQENAAFDEIVVLVNSSNAPELSWIDDFSKIHTVIQSPCTGKTGLYALPQILQGNVSASGHVATTFATDLLAAPAAQNIDEGIYTVDGVMPDGSTYLGYNYTVYAESIYIGYRYYETRYEDYIIGTGNAGEFHYADEVIYPFGYGLSTTSFEWSDFRATWDDEDNCAVEVVVKNTGTIAGRDVVQVYAQSPYTEYDKQNGIEKSAVELVGFTKTSMIQPGESETVKITFTQEQLKSYDANGAGTYILEGGNYYITAAVDAHAAINNILRVKAPEKADKFVASPAEMIAGNAEFVSVYMPMEEGIIDVETYSVDSTTGTKITNQFEDATQDDITYLTRNDWVGTFPKAYGTVSSVESQFGNKANAGTKENPKAYMYTMNLTQEEYNRLYGTDSLNPTEDSAYLDTVRLEEDNDLKLIDLRGLDYKDPLWDDLIAQMSAKEMADLIAKSGYGTITVGSIGKLQTLSADGPTGLSSAIPMTSPAMLAQTWDVDLAYQFGELVGNDALLKDVSGWYAPGLNIYRTPFTGRCNEYYSEDSFLSGMMAAQEVRGAASKGLAVYLKHFAVNETENHRGDRAGNYGLVTWLNEQSMREIYLEAFELAVKSGTVTQYYFEKTDDETLVKTEYEVPACLGVMTSFNRIGYTWAGGHYNLITEVLRNEWGFEGEVLTDFDNGGFMDTWQAIRSGAGSKLNYTGSLDLNGELFTLSDDMTSAEYHYVKEAVKWQLYTLANSVAVNGQMPGVEINTGFRIDYYVLIIVALDVLVVSGIFWYQRKKRVRK